MKRKIFLTLLITLALISIFAFAISAEAYDETRTTIEYTDINGTTHTVPVVKSDVEVSVVNEAIRSDTSRERKCDLSGLTNMADNSALCILKDTNGGLTAYPSWYIIDAIGTAIYEISYGYLNSLTATTGKSYTEGAIVYMEFPQGMSNVRSNGVFGMKTNGNPYETNVTDFHIPKTVESIDSNAFNSMPNLKNVFIEEGSPITAINGSTFSVSNVEYVQFENLTELTSIDGFSSCKNLKSLDLSNCVNLTTIQSGTFSGCTALESLDLSKCVNLTTIKSSAFNGCTGLGPITLPDSLTSIGDDALSNLGNGYLTSSYLPASLEWIGKHFFAYNTNLLETYIFPVGVKALADEPFQDSKVAGGPSGKELNLVFLGEVTGIVYLNGNGHQKHAEKVTVYFAQNSCDQYNTNGFKIKPSSKSTTSVPDAIRAAFCKGTGAGTNGSVTGVEYVYITNVDGTSFTSDYVNHADYGFDFDNHKHFGARVSLAETCGKDGFEGVSCIVCDTQIGEIVPATGNHTTEDDGNCETEVICLVCQSVVIEAISHVLGEVYSYDKGYLETGTFKIGCTNKGCTHGETTEIPALAISKGFSQEIGENTGAIVFGITFNREAIKAYEKYLNTTIDFGLIASSVQDESPLNSDASAKTGTIKNSFAEATYSIFQIKLIGIEEAQYAQLFHCGGYFLVDGEISYVNNKSIGSTSTLVSYNIVTTLVEKKD